MKVKRRIWIPGGTTWVVEGAVAYMADINKVGAIIPIPIGIGGFIAAFRGKPQEG